MTGYYLVKSSALWPISERLEFQQELKMQILSLESLNRDAQEKQGLCCREKKMKLMLFMKILRRIASVWNHWRSKSGCFVFTVQLDDREKVELNLKEKEKELVGNIVQVQSSLSAVECSLAEAKKKYVMMLEAKQLKSH
ncbi:uncharacterized protein LOC116250288 [Nymphaea colorata]|nr:uncharacterized protein LOC116250081 [Nymphaea colorata]XP_031479775.1 uncharacterized protein LOC116250288 [Nymphaea colorata]